MFFFFSFSGYTRIILSLLSFTFMPFQPAVAATCYLLSVVLDEFDGRAARKFNQGKMHTFLNNETCSISGLCLACTCIHCKYEGLLQTVKEFFSVASLPNYETCKKNVGLMSPMATSKSSVVSSLPRLVAFWGFHVPHF